MKDNKGAVMVETVIIFPMVMMTVFFLFYLGLIKLQDMAILYQVQRTAHQGSMVVAVPGYGFDGGLGDLSPYNKKQIDREPMSFASSSDAVKIYYEAYHKSLGVLYREISGYGGWTGKNEIQDEIHDFLEKMGDDTMVLAGVKLLDEKAEIHRGLLSTKVDAEVTFGFPAPGVLRYFGYEGEMRFKQGATATALNPAGFVRNVDLACNVAGYASKKMGIDENVENIRKWINKYIF